MGVLDVPSLIPRIGGQWASGSAYTVGTQITFGLVTYDCIVGHTAGTYFLTDFQAGKWRKVAHTIRPSNVLASLGDSIACNGSGNMTYATLSSAANIGDTSVSVNAPPTGATAAEFASGSLIKIGNEYVQTSANATGSGPYVLALAGSLAAGHPVNTPVVRVNGTSHGNGVPSAALIAVIQSGGQLRYGGSFGHGSYTAEQIRDYYLPMVTAAAPGWCYVMAGRNSLGGDGVATTLGLICFLWDTLLAAGITPIASTLPPIPSASTTTDKQANQNLNAGISREAAKRGIPVTDLYGQMVDPSTGNYLAAYLNDGTHPNDDGRLIQGQGVWSAISAIVPHTELGLPMTNAYSDTNVYPFDIDQANAVMASSGGTNNTGGQSSVLPLNWTTSLSDTVGTVSIGAQSGWVGQGMTVNRASGATSGTNQVTVQTKNTATLVAGRRYELSFRIKTSGVTAAAAADAGFGGFYVGISNSSAGGAQTYFALDPIKKDLNGVIVADFIVGTGAPTGLFFFLKLRGTASTPAYSVIVGQVMIKDLTGAGESASSNWP